MTVLQRAMADGQESAVSAREVLISNNSLTRPLLLMVPDEGALPSMETLQQQASSRVFESLSKLAEQCTTAGFQPLEVFTRSVQCTTHNAALDSLAAKGHMHKRLLLMADLSLNLESTKGSWEDPGFSQACLQDMCKAGVYIGTAILALGFIGIYRAFQKEDLYPERLHRADMDMLPGKARCPLLYMLVSVPQAAVLFSVNPALLARCQLPCWMCMSQAGKCRAIATSISFHLILRPDVWPQAVCIC